MSDRKSRSWLRRAFVPSLPRFRSSVGLSLPEAGRTLADSLSRGAQLCPYDGAEMTLADVFDQNSDGNIVGEAQRGFVCPDCGAVVPVQTLSADLKKDADAMRRSERDYFLSGVATVFVFGGLSLYTGYLATFIGGLVFSLLLLMMSLTYRYRAWQAETGNLFLHKAPIREWIRSELSK